MALKELFVLVCVVRAALRERLNEATRGGRGVEKQHAARFAAAVLPRMRDVARHERARAGPAGGDFVADLEGELAGKHPGDLVAVAVQVIRLVVPAGRVSSNIMMLSPVSRPRSFNAKERPGVGELKCFPPPAGTTKPFAGVMSLPFLWWKRA